MSRLSLKEAKDVTISIRPRRCKYYSPHMKTVRAYVQCLYDIEGCECGGLLHILLDENNITDSDILYCLKSCIENPEREESRIGQIICEEYLKLSVEQRSLLVDILEGDDDIFCYDYSECHRCLHMRLKRDRELNETKEEE